MKKLFASCLLAGLTFLGIGHAQAGNSMKGYDRDPNRVALGVAYYSIHDSVAGVDANGHGWAYGLEFKHEAVDDWFYALSFDYTNPRIGYAGSKNLDTGWAAEALLGYSWGWGDKAILTPFVGVGYAYDKLRVRSQNYNIISYGTAITIGAHTNYMINDSWDIGLWAAVDWVVTGRFKPGATITGGNGTSLTAGSYNYSSAWGVSFDLPLTWYLWGAMQGWDLALHGLYSYDHTKLSGQNVTSNTNIWGGMLELGYNF